MASSCSVERAQCRLRTVPDWILDKTELTRLSLRQNQIPVLPSSIGVLVMLEDLDVSENELLSIPPEIGHLIHLKALHASANQLSALPKSLCNCVKLRTMVLSRNGLTRMPAWLASLTALRRLDIAENRFQLGSVEVIPSGGGPLDVLWRCTSLVSLSLDSNPLTILPAHLALLNQLTSFSAMRCSLEALPPQICHVPLLKSLRLSSNNIAALPQQMGNLMQLRELLLDDCLIMDLPPLMAQCTSLTTLRMTRCPLQWPLDGFVLKGAHAVLQFLRDRLEAEVQAKPMFRSVEFSRQDSMKDVLPQSSSSPFLKKKMTQGEADEVRSHMGGMSRFFSHMLNSEVDGEDSEKPSQYDLLQSKHWPSKPPKGT